MRKNFRKQAVGVLAIMCTMGMSTLSVFAAENEPSTDAIKCSVAVEAEDVAIKGIAALKDIKAEMITVSIAGQGTDGKNAIPYKVVKQEDVTFVLLDEATGETINMQIKTQNGKIGKNSFVMTSEGGAEQNQ